MGDSTRAIVFWANWGIALRLRRPPDVTAAVNVVESAADLGRLDPVDPRLRSLPDWAERVDGNDRSMGQ